MAKLGNSAEGKAAERSVGASPAGEQAAELSAEELQKRAAASKGISAAFGEIVAVLARSQHYKHYSLADLEWLAAPAIALGQFAKADAQHKTLGFTTPIAIVMWAKVSEEVDQRLSAALDQPIRLKPQEWKSGDIAWVVVAEGEQRATAALLQQIKERLFKDATLKARVMGPNGKAVVANLAVQAPAAPATQKA